MKLTKLSDLEFKNLYDTHKDDIATAFYEKALTHAKFYDRVSAFFDSKILSRYSAGIEYLYDNNGKIRFIFSEELAENDFNQMKEGYDARALKKLNESFIRESLDEIDKNNLSNLAFLIEQGLVDIKIAFVKPGILHDKMGIIYDDTDSIYFRGSNNETVAALEANHESFEVSCSRDGQEKENEKINEAKIRFEQLWNNQYDEGIIVVDIPNIIKNKLAEYNKGKLILKNSISYDDAIVADITDNSEFVVLNNLDGDIDITKCFDFKNFIKKYLDECYGNTYKFGKISYVKILSLLEHFVDLADDIGKRFIETPKLKQFLDDKVYEIEKVKNLGVMIKNQNPFVMGEFKKFEGIVNNELERVLRPKQMWNAFFICEMVKSANYSVPGSGKTSIVYGAYAYLTSNEKKKVDTMIVVGPISSFKSWIDEYYLCFGQKRNPKILNTLTCKNKNEKISKLKNNKYDLILVNYEALNSLKDVLSDIINSETLLVFDEIHKVKRVGGVWATAALSICKFAKYKVALTGTPIPNSYADLYNQLNILYTDEYNTFFNMLPAKLSQKDESVQNEINEKIYPFFCRTTKKDLSVPEPNPDIKIISHMNDDEMKLFSMIHKKYNRNPLLLYIRLLQASTNPALVLHEIDDIMLEDLCEFEDENEENFELDDNLNGVKEKIVLDKEEENLIKSFDMTSKFWDGIDKIKNLVYEGKTVLVWGIFVSTINRISEELKKLGIENDVIYGAVPPEKREEIIENFKSKKIKVLITNPHTMAESVSLHRTCHDAIYFEYSFNLTHMLQSRDRINRLGLPDGQYTQYYYLFLLNNSGEDDSIDLKTYDRLKEKESIMINAIEGEQIISIDFDILDDLRIIMHKN